MDVPPNSDAPSRCNNARVAAEELSLADSKPAICARRRRMGSAAVGDLPPSPVLPAHVDPPLLHQAGAPCSVRAVVIRRLGITLVVRSKPLFRCSPCSVLASTHTLTDPDPGPAVTDGSDGRAHILFAPGPGTDTQSVIDVVLLLSKALACPRESSMWSCPSAQLPNSFHCMFINKSKREQCEVNHRDHTLIPFSSEPAPKGCRDVSRGGVVPFPRA